MIELAGIRALDGLTARKLMTTSMSDFHWNSLQDLFAIQEKMNRLFEETIHRTEFPDEGL